MVTEVSRTMVAGLLIAGKAMHQVQTIPAALTTVIGSCLQRALQHRSAGCIPWTQQQAQGAAGRLPVLAVVPKEYSQLML